MSYVLDENGLRFAYLFWSEGGYANHNKYYRMQENPDHLTFTAYYGREGSTPQKKVYPISDWEKVYRNKTSGRKKYQDQTSLHIRMSQSNVPGYAPLGDTVMDDIMDFLQAKARQSVTENYSVSSSQVTERMVKEAQRLLDGLADMSSTESFNEGLIQLFHVIPRKMRNVNDFLAENPSDFWRILQHEQDTLDVMAGQVTQNVVAAHADNGKTILDVLGIKIKPVSADEESMIKKLLGQDRKYFYRAVRVTNTKTQQAYDAYLAENPMPAHDRRLLWHGSRNENWISILQSGLVLRPHNVVTNGKMFGMGIYFAPLADKSLKYSSLLGSYYANGSDRRAYMALFETAYGKPYNVNSNHGIDRHFGYKELQRVCPGANCLHAHGGHQLVNDEIIFYREDQITIKYLVEVRC